MIGLRVDLLPLLGPDLGLDVLDRPPILLELGAHHPEARLHLGLPRGVQRGVLADQVLVLVFIVCLWCYLPSRLQAMSIIHIKMYFNHLKLSSVNA